MTIDSSDLDHCLGDDAPRPLYLAPEGELWVGLDGPALRLSSLEHAEQLYPLRRIGRIHSGRQVAWEMDALMACADQGIPVVFVDDDGQVQARLLGRPGQRDELRSRLVEFLLLPEAHGRLRHWMDTHRHRAARWTAIKLGIGTQIVGAPAIRQWINRSAEHYAGARHAQLTRQWLRGLAYTWMEEHLSDLGFGRSNELGQAGSPCLAADLTDIFYWYLEPTRHGWLKRRALTARQRREPVRPPTQRDVVRLFESRAIRAAARGREITGNLHRWLIHET